MIVIPSIVLNDIEKSFHGKSVLKNISLDLEPGVYGLVGPNGAGKSTLIRIICGVLKADHGAMYWNGQEISQVTQFKEILGVMPQNQDGYRQFSGMEFLLYMACLKGINWKTAHSRIMTLAEEVGLTDDLSKKVGSYSGGMRQRLMFIQAMLNDPRILILDEPTAGLDPYERIRMRNLISRCAKNRIILIATHIMQDLETIADHLIFLHHGMISFSGTTGELMKFMQGKVCEKTISKEEFEKIYQTRKITRAIQINGQWQVRYLCQENEKGNCTPELEDAYMELLC